jgi:hypothetical protein
MGWPQDLGRLLLEGEGALSIQWAGHPHPHVTVFPNPETNPHLQLVCTKLTAFLIHSYPTQCNSNLSEYIVYIQYGTTYIHLDMNLL